MASVTFPVELGGDGSTVSDDSNSATGLKRGGHRTRFVAALAQFVAMCASALTNAQAASASAASAVNAPGTSATCITSINIPSAFPTDIVFTLQQTGKLYTTGQTLVFSDSADPEKQFSGVLISFNSGTGAGTLRARQSNGVGLLSNWKVAISTPLDSTLTGRVTTLEQYAVDTANDRLFYNGELF